MVEFGTDGFRGKASDFDSEGLKRIGYELAKDGLFGRVVIGYDTRMSSLDFKQDLIEGINAANTDVIDLGVVTTPTVAYFSKVIPEAKYGIMITASHNPYYDNGIKVFQYGNKVDSNLEGRLISAYNSQGNIVSSNKSSIILRDPINYLKHIERKNIDSIDRKIVLDLANGAASNLAKKLFNKRNYIFTSDMPNGRNINEDCGIMHPANIERKVLGNGAYMGISFDGDCDRVGICDENGKFIDGDFLLGFLAKDMLLKGELQNNSVVITEYSNVALENYIKSFGGKVHRVKNGDKAVFAKMKEVGSNFGGEKLGHIIYGIELGTGDGLLTASEILSRLDYSKSVSEQLRAFELNPQVILNVPVVEKIPFEQISGYEDVINRAKKELNGSGRVLVRYSGTENYCRIMLEGKDTIVLNQVGKEIASKFI